MEADQLECWRGTVQQERGHVELPKVGLWSEPVELTSLTLSSSAIFSSAKLAVFTLAGRSAAEVTGLTVIVPAADVSSVGGQER